MISSERVQISEVIYSLLFIATSHGFCESLLVGSQTVMAHKNSSSPRQCTRQVQLRLELVEDRVMQIILLRVLREGCNRHTAQVVRR